MDELPTEGALKGFLEGLMREERAVYLAATPRERTPLRRDWANGHYTRDLGTERGLIRDLRVLRVRGQGLSVQGCGSLQAPTSPGGWGASGLFPLGGVHPARGVLREGAFGRVCERLHRVPGVRGSQS